MILIYYMFRRFGKATNEWKHIPYILFIFLNKLYVFTLYSIKEAIVSSGIENCVDNVLNVINFPFER